MYSNIFLSVRDRGPSCRKGRQKLLLIRLSYLGRTGRNLHKSASERNTAWTEGIWGLHGQGHSTALDLCIVRVGARSQGVWCREVVCRGRRRHGAEYGKILMQKNWRQINTWDLAQNFRLVLYSENKILKNDYCIVPFKKTGQEKCLLHIQIYSWNLYITKLDQKNRVQKLIFKWLSKITKILNGISRSLGM